MHLNLFFILLVDRKFQYLYGNFNTYIFVKYELYGTIHLLFTTLPCIVTWFVLPLRLYIITTNILNRCFVKLLEGITLYKRGEPYMRNCDGSYHIFPESSKPKQYHAIDNWMSYQVIALLLISAINTNSTHFTFSIHPDYPVGRQSC